MCYDSVRLAPNSIYSIHWNRRYVQRLFSLHSERVCWIQCDFCIQVDHSQSTYVQYCSWNAQPFVLIDGLFVRVTHPLNLLVRSVAAKSIKCCESKISTRWTNAQLWHMLTQYGVTFHSLRLQLTLQMQCKHSDWCVWLNCSDCLQAATNLFQVWLKKFIPPAGAPSNFNGIVHHKTHYLFGWNYVSSQETFYLGAQ